MIDDGDGDDETRAIIIMRSLSHRYIYGSIDKRRQIVCVYMCIDDDNNHSIIISQRPFSGPKNYSK